MNPTSNDEVLGSIPRLAQRVKDPVLLWARLDLAFLWLWYRPVATALIRPVAWEPPYATGVALKRQKEKKKKPNYSFI